MSQAAVELIQNALDAYGRGDAAVIFDLADPDIVVVAQFGLAQAGRYEGREAMAQYMRDWEDAWEEMEYEPEEWLVDGNAVVVVIRYHGRGKGSGVVVDDLFAWRFVLDDAKIAKWGVYSSRAEAIEAAGLRE
jgi:ketosteroid isomerase-like protein